jgi:hypothetical protein
MALFKFILINTGLTDSLSLDCESAASKGHVCSVHFCVKIQKISKNKRKKSFYRSLKPRNFINSYVVTKLKVQVGINNETICV